MKNTGARAQMRQVYRVLNEGGVVRFIHRDGWAILVSADGELSTTLDGRTYAGFLTTLAPKLKRTESGSIDGGDFVVEWNL